MLVSNSFFNRYETFEPIIKTLKKRWWSDHRMSRRELKGLFPWKFSRNFKTHEAGHCVLVDHPHRAAIEMLFPACDECCKGFFGVLPMQVCPICFEHLPNEKISAQFINQYDFRNRIHDGDCWEYFSVACGLAMGILCKFELEEQNNVVEIEPIHVVEEYRPPGPEPEDTPTDDAKLDDPHRTPPIDLPGIVPDSWMHYYKDVWEGVITYANSYRP